MFDHLTAAPADPILGLTEAYLEDPNPHKINLGVGVFKDEQGRTPVLSTVIEAETRMLQGQQTKSYLPIPGDAAYGRVVRSLMMGEDHELVENGRMLTAHTPGGTGALRIAGELMRKLGYSGRIWVSNPTWANHKGIFKGAGFEWAEYRYYDKATRGLDMAGLLADLKVIPQGDVVLLHACCHNPTGVDPDAEQWAAIAEVAQTQGWLPIMDFAYQGLGSGLESDRQGLLTMAAACPELMVCGSFSKNFGLYRERTGSLSLLAASAQSASNAFSHMKKVIRVTYSNPPAHGGAVVMEILSDPDLHERWMQEVAGMRERIHATRKALVQSLKNAGSAVDYSFLEHQNGMFSFSGLNAAQSEWLRKEKSIYIVNSGRINVAGITPANMSYLVQSMLEVESMGR